MACDEYRPDSGVVRHYVCLSAAFGIIDNRRNIIFDFNTMKRSIEDTPIVFIGAGNLATNLAKALYRKGFRIVQIYSRTEESARNLAEKVEAEFTTDLGDINPYARLYIVSLKDSAFTELLPDIVAGKERNLCWYILPGVFR